MSQGEKYYGGYFWVAVISFIIPLAVAWKAFDRVQPTTKPKPVLDASGVDHAVWDYLLKNYVSSGLVDYEGMKKDYLFHEYIRQLGACDPERLETEDAKLALASNAYNAFVINGVVSHKIKDNVLKFKLDGTGFFDIPEHIYAGKTISLNQLEHKMIRPTFGEPRIHVSLVCAARSCPSIRPEAYTGDRVREQMQDQSVQFASNPTYVHFDKQKNELQINPILEWYGDDWDAKYNQGSYLQWLDGLTNDQNLKDAIAKAIAFTAAAPTTDGVVNAAAIQKAFKDIPEGQFRIAFNTYDWSLNSQKESSGSSSGGGGGDFGSGISPDE